MPEGRESIVTDLQDFENRRLDLSSLVGSRVTVFSRQFPGKRLFGKVVSVSDKQILVESGSRIELIDNLVSGQMVVLQFPYKSREIAVRACLKRTSSGRCHFVFEDGVTPLAQRRFKRLGTNSTVRLAVFPMTGHKPEKLAQLRWLETDVINFSSGGMLATVPSALEHDTRLLLNIKLENLPFPRLVLGRVRHCYRVHNRECRIGVEFLVREEAQHLFAPSVMRKLPQTIFSYSRSHRIRLDEELANRKSTTSESQ